jgi:hypothetical protein
LLGTGIQFLKLLGHPISPLLQRFSYPSDFILDILLVSLSFFDKLVEVGGLSFIAGQEVSLLGGLVMLPYEVLTLPVQICLLLALRLEVI